MPDEYWLIMDRPIFGRLNWPRKTRCLGWYCDWYLIEGFATKLREEHPDWKIDIGVTRGDRIHVIR